jgi:hypothetical protein
MTDPDYDIACEEQGAFLNANGIDSFDALRRRTEPNHLVSAEALNAYITRIRAAFDDALGRTK